MLPQKEGLCLVEKASSVYNSSANVSRVLTFSPSSLSVLGLKFCNLISHYLHLLIYIYIYIYLYILFNVLKWSNATSKSSIYLTFSKLASQLTCGHHNLQINFFVLIIWYVILETLWNCCGFFAYHSLIILKFALPKTDYLTICPSQVSIKAFLHFHFTFQL